MSDNIWFTAAFWMGLAFVASLVSIRTGISVALIEILVGVIVGNLHAAGQASILHTTEWINFLAMLGSGVLTFLAGAEIDPASLRGSFRASMSIGVGSFLLPFLCVWVFAQFVLGWPLRQAWIAGIALSTTSVAVVYAVMIEGGLGSTAMGKMLLAACFITDFGTVLALGVLFGLQNKIISQQQYSMLVTVVILSAFVPTLLAQRLFQPTVRMMTAWGRLYSHRINRKSAVLSAPVKG